MDYLKITLCGTLWAAIAVGAVPAQARKPVVVTATADTLSRTVSIRDLNLTSPADLRALKSRVGNVVHRVCHKINNGARDLNIQGACRDLAWREASPQIARAVLRAEQLASTGQSRIAATPITLTFGG